jgi:hypothetical protein
MKDEKRQTRLLPFRLRRSDAGRRVLARTGAGLHADADDTEMDAELRAALREWDAPQQSHDARARLLADFRAVGVRRPLWRRALSARLQVPVPVAACAFVALLASLVAVAARTTTQTRVAAAEHSAIVETSGATTSPAPVVQVVEVPVVRERVVTRVVYVEKKERARNDGVLEPSASSASGGANAEKRRAADSRDDASATSFFTRVDMADFRPADEMKIRIVRKGGTDEK